MEQRKIKCEVCGTVITVTKAKCPNLEEMDIDQLLLKFECPKCTGPDSTCGFLYNNAKERRLVRVYMKYQINKQWNKQREKC